ncbi:transient receptor potential cation channel subfamily A member 1 homolog isoform X2 [Penaeus japonicus]|nr:transient receptor potential cation channel subfamily A member 1 homolog isoform X2 [Penaeus japonicus]XP_042868460.1 transient receptor potential cation channel subfamily A member 1 homolog isoform X2 [Penaeus japonicus]
MGAQSPAQIPLLQRLTRGALRRQRQQQQAPNNAGAHVVRFQAGTQERNGNKRQLYRRADSVRERYAQLNDSTQGYKYTEKLLQLVGDDKYEEVKALLEEGRDVNVQDEGTGMTALHIAASNGFTGVLSLLLSEGAYVNAQDNTEQTPLHFAVRKDHFDCCQLLLEHPNIDVNLSNKERNTALHVAAKEGRNNICDLILDQVQVQVNAKNKRGMTALHLAAQENQPQVLRLLIEKGGLDWKIQDSNFYLPLHYAAQKGFPECCEVLMSTDIKDNKVKQLTTCLKDGKTALMLAAKNGHHKCCEKLTSNNINARDKSGATALHYAASGGYEITVAELLEIGANPNTQNKKGSAPVLDAAAKKKTGCLSALLTKGANPNVFDKQGKGVLHYAAEKNAEDSMRLLLEIPSVESILNSKDKDKCTALHLAIKREAVECALILLEEGSSATEECAGGMTPLHLAADKGYTIICEKLFAKPEVQVSKENDMKATPLHLAALHGSVDVCQMLLRKGARQTAVDVNGRTALHLASGKGNANVVKFLCRKGVPNKAKDDTGSNALHLAAASSEEGALECCKLLSSNAKALISDVDRDQNLPIDKAFEKNHDEIFRLLLKKLVFKDNQDNRMLTLHKYMHEALEAERLSVVEAIIDSEWWESGFIGKNGHHCENFRILVKDYPDLALKVQEKCVKRVSNSETKYDFRLYNDNYYIPSDTEKRALSPFDSVTGQVLPKAQPFTDGLPWKNSHPLALMVSHTRQQNLQHPLSKAWMLQQWRSYACKIFMVLLINELFFVISLISFMAYVDNWNRIEIRCGFTKDAFIRISEQDKGSLNNETRLQFDECNALLPTKFALWIAVVFTMFVMLILESNFLFRLKKEYFCFKGNLVRVLRSVCTLIILIPQGLCQYNYLVLNILQWQFGVAALLLAWLHLINTLNELPMLSVFMPITNSFMKSFFKVLVYILMLVFVFAFIFHLLLQDHNAFSNVPQALVKTIVWMLGDLAYDDTFLAEDNSLFYPVMVNSLFVVFVTIIGGFIVNLIITQPSNKLDDFREKASFHLDANRVALFLHLDICFPFFKKMRTTQFFVDNIKDKNHNFFMRKLLMLDVKEEAPEAPSPLQIQLEEQGKHISILLNLQMEQREEIQELKHQLKILVNKTLE